MTVLEISLLSYQGLITLVILALFWVTLFNLLAFRRLPAKGQFTTSDAPKVSILVPARNEERGVEACVRSLCEQKYPNYEVFVLDDGSTDSTAEILASTLSCLSPPDDTHRVLICLMNG